MSRLNNALIAHWKLNDNADSATVVDAMGNHNGTYHGTGGADDYTSSHDVTGKINGALDFDGTQDYIEIADHADFTFGDGTNDSPFSISAWFLRKSGGVTPDWHILNKIVQATGAYEWYLYIEPEGVVFRIYGVTTVGSNFQGRNAVVDTSPLDQWYYVIVTYDGRGGVTAYEGMKIYLDGIRVDDTTHNSGTYVAMFNGAGPLQIGKIQTLYNSGQIDNVMIFNVELTAGEVDRLYNNGQGSESLTGVEIRTTLPRRISRASLPLRVRYEK